MASFTDLMLAAGKQLGYELEIEDNTCAVGSNDVTVLIMGITENGEETLVMTAELGVPPPQNLEKLYETMMSAMFAHQSTGGGSFARNPESGSIWLQRMEPIECITPEMLIARVTQLGQAATEWKKIIEDFREIDPTPSDKSEFDEMPGLGEGFMNV